MAGHVRAPDGIASPRRKLCCTSGICTMCARCRARALPGRRLCGDDGPGCRQRCREQPPIRPRCRVVGANGRAVVHAQAGRGSCGLASTRRSVRRTRSHRRCSDSANTISDPLADVKSAERWLASFPANDPLASQRERHRRARQLAERTARAHAARARGRLLRRRHAAGLRKNLTAQYIEHASRSSKIEHQLWSALFDLTQAFLLVLPGFAREVADHAQSAKWQALLPELIARQIMHLGLDAKIRLYRYEQWIPAKWAELHALFTLACSRQIERQQLVLGPSGEHDDDRARVPDHAAAAAHELRQHDARGTWSGWPASSTNGARRCG